MKPLAMTKLSLKSLFKAPVTVAYPVVPREYFPATRGHIIIEPSTCNLCVICDVRCPTKAIKVDRAGKTWTIDRLRCIQCGACVEACPRKCLTNGNTYSEPVTEKTVFVVPIPFTPPPPKLRPRLRHPRLNPPRPPRRIPMQKTVPYSMAIESRYPEQIAVCIARDANGRYNPMTIGWFMPVSMKPAMIAIAVGRDRHTLEAIRLRREFTLAFLSEPQADLARYFGTHSGRDTDKFEATGCATIPAEKIDSRLIKDAVANFECAVRQEVEAGDHIVFIGEVLRALVTDNPVNRMFTLIKGEHLDGVRQK